MTDLPKIRVNRARCLLCHDELISEDRYDFKTCTCGNLSVDGGKFYIKRSAKYPLYVEELSEYE